VCVSINVLGVTVNYCFSVEALVIVEWIGAPKSVRIDDQRLFFVVFEKKSHRCFVGGFCRDDISLTGAPTNECEHQRFVLLIRSSSAF
jgi:hypothetical protein